MQQVLRERLHGTLAEQHVRHNRFLLFSGDDDMTVLAPDIWQDSISPSDVIYMSVPIERDADVRTTACPTTGCDGRLCMTGLRKQSW